MVGGGRGWWRFWLVLGVVVLVVVVLGVVVAMVVGRVVVVGLAWRGVTPRKHGGRPKTQARGCSGEVGRAGFLVNRRGRLTWRLVLVV